MLGFPKIAVVGSLAIDYFTRVEQFPAPGETVMARDLEIRFGGKGANQAVAAVRLGAKVEMIGCVGSDEMGQQYLRRLEDFGIGTVGVGVVAGAATGSAFITLDATAENTIVFAPGANSCVSAGQVESQASLIAGADVLLLQNEVPPEANAAAVAIARESQTEIFYNPAPWRDGGEVALARADCLIVNEIEAAALLGFPVSALAQLSEHSGIVVTRGARSTLASMAGQLFEVSPPQITPVDTVGAGDTFAGALAVFAAKGRGDFGEVLRRANAAAAFSTRRVGAQEAMPTFADLEELTH
jgi:ribokinase